jgi:Protein of unknown function (DUF3108)
MRSIHVHRSAGAVLVVLAVALLTGFAQSSERRYPFAAGERAEYQVRLGSVSVGSGSIEVVGMAEVAGEQTYHTRMRVSGGVGFARVNDRYESWIDADGLFSRRFIQNIHEVRYRRNRTFDFFPDRMVYRREDGDEGPLASNRPLDDLSFMYYVRTLPLEVGDEYTLNRYFKESGNPVVVKVLRKETIEVPAGTFRTIVVQPVIKTDGLFGEGGRAEIHFSDDRHRIPVLIKSRVPVVGSLTMRLRSFRPAP